MSKTSKTVLWIVVVLVVLIGAWMLFAKPSDNTSIPAYTDTTQTQTPQDQNQTTTSTSVSNPSDTSDASVNSDVSSIDSQMNGLNADSTASASGSDNQ